LIGAFLAHLEDERGNSVRTRNARLTAIHSFFQYASLEAPDHAEVIQRVLAVPQKRFDTTLISYLQPPEVEALLDSPDRATRIGRRDRALLVLAVQTACASPSSQASAARTCSSAPRRTSAVTGKAERRGARR